MHQQFADSISHIPGLLKALTESEPTVSIRYNPRKGMALRTIEGEAVPWCATGVYLPSRPKFTLDPAMHQGAYYVQDASSMFIAEAIAQIRHHLPQDEPLKYLDACAAPGGKTTAAIDALPEGSLVVANEFDPRRAHILAENVIKWGYPNIVVSRGDTAQFKALKGEFDIIAVDAPCSGEGMMRKERMAVEQWTPQLVEQCAERQREILGNVLPALKSGGYLIYSTCTFNATENEDIVDWLTDEYDLEVMPLEVDPDWGIATNGRGAHFYPSHVRGEGLFISVLRSTSVTPSRRSKDSSAKVPKSAKPHIAQSWLTNSQEFIVEESDAQVTAYPKAWYADIKRYGRTLTALLQGVTLATKKGKSLIPTQQLAMSLCLDTASHPTVEVDRDTALSYLRREALTLPDGTPKGYTLLFHNGLPLGWVNNLGNRANNLYPEAWRIRL